MAECVITNTYRKKILKAIVGSAPLPAIVAMAFGDGAVNADTPSVDAIELKRYIDEKALDGNGRKQMDDKVIRFTCTLAVYELIGNTINEIGLIDADGDLAVIKEFSGKTKDGDMEMIFDVDIAL